MVTRSSPSIDYFALFLKSREAIGVSIRTLEFYRDRLSKFVSKNDCMHISCNQIENFLGSIPPNTNGYGTRHCSYRALKTFFRWLQRAYGISNPMKDIPAPIIPKPILPALTRTQVSELIDNSPNLRAKAIIALFVESGLRIMELSNIKYSDIDWESRTVRILGKGRKEAEAPFGPLTERYVREYIQENELKINNDGNIWGIHSHGIASMLRRLQKSTGITCNAHTFRRTFAVLLRKDGVDVMNIQNLGRWETMQMVQRYTRTFTFRDSMKFYKAPLGEEIDEL